MDAVHKNRQKRRNRLRFGARRGDIQLAHPVRVQDAMQVFVAESPHTHRRVVLVLLHIGAHAEQYLVAVLNRESGHTPFGLDPATFEALDVEGLNA
jgi:hypothetical protein